MADTYDPKEVSAIVGGHIVDGYADGQFIEIQRDEDAFDLTIGSNGAGARAKSNNKSATVNIALLQSSDSNDVFSGFALADELNGGGQIAFILKDNNGRTLCAAGTLWVQKFANVVFDRTIQSREWAFRTDEMQMFVGGL